MDSKQVSAARKVQLIASCALRFPHAGSSFKMALESVRVFT